MDEDENITIEELIKSISYFLPEELPAGSDPDIER